MNRRDYIWIYGYPFLGDVLEWIIYYNRATGIGGKSALDRYIHYPIAQAWKEQTSAIGILKSGAIIFFSDIIDDFLLAGELTHPLEGLEIKKLPAMERANMQSGYEIDPCCEKIRKTQGT